MAEAQVITGAFGVKDSGKPRSREGRAEVSEYVATMSAVAGLVEDAAMTPDGANAVVLRDHIVLLRSIAREGVRLEGADYDSIPGIHICGEAGRSVGLLADALTMRDGIKEPECWALVRTLECLAQAVGDWAQEWYGDFDTASGEVMSCAN